MKIKHFVEILVLSIWFILLSSYWIPFKDYVLAPIIMLLTLILLLAMAKGCVCGFDSDLKQRIKFGYK